MSMFMMQLCSAKDDMSMFMMQLCSAKDDMSMFMMQLSVFSERRYGYARGF